MAKKSIIRKILRITVNCFVVFLMVNILWANFFSGSYQKIINFILGISEPPAEEFRIAVLDDEGTAEIITYIVNTPEPKNIIDIPAEIDGKMITKIGFGAFSGHRHITEITIPDIVTIIADSAFYSSGILKVTLSAGVTHIGSQAFRYNNLSEIVIPANVQTIGPRAFADNTIKTITIPSNVELQNETHPVFENGFDDFYTGNGRNAGMYTYLDNSQSWTQSPRPN